MTRSEQFFIMSSCHYWTSQVHSSLCSSKSEQGTTVQTERGQKQEERCSHCYCTTVGKNAHSRKSPTSCLPPPDSSEPAVLIPDWLGSLSGLEHGHKTRPISRRRRGEEEREIPNARRWSRRDRQYWKNRTKTQTLKRTVMGVEVLDSMCNVSVFTSKIRRLCIRESVGHCWD